MRCHYEVIGVSLYADDDEIKKAYRKSALKLHPDKNIGRELKSAEEFKELQAAYATLSDPQERAFYDRNRESIVRGRAGGTSSSIPDPFEYFSTNCFPGGFTDASDGFYSTYRKFFLNLTSKDSEYAKKENVPQFGHASSDLDDVAQFYGYWTSYCTSISFAWCDQVDIREARNRRMEKEITKENKKFRDEKRKKFNESVRQLAYYCRRRDPRWKKRIEIFEQQKIDAEKKHEEQKAKNAEVRRELFERDMKDENIKKMREEYLQKLEELDNNDEVVSHYSVDSNDEDQSQHTSGNSTDCEEEEFDPLACEICIKVFNSLCGLESHLKSKNHRKRLQKFLEEHNLKDEPIINDEVSNSGHSTCDEEIVDSKREKKTKKRLRKIKLKNKKAGFYVSESESDEENLNQDGIKSDASECNEKPHDDNCTQEVSNESDKEKLMSNLVEEIKLTDTKEEAAPTSSQVKPKLKGKKAKEARQKANKCKGETLENICQICNNNFTSKNKLFEHIKKSGHAVLKEVAAEKKKRKK